MRIRTFLHAAFVFPLSLALSSCGGSDSITEPQDDHEHEVITSVILSVVDSATGSTIDAVRFVDADGEGGKPPVLPDTLRLRTGRVYHASVRFLDESHPTDVHDLNEEIGGSESDDHAILWIPSSGALSVAVTDTDSKGLPLGLHASLKTSSTVGPMVLRVNLRHLPGIKTASSGPADGETDADVEFPVSIQGS